MLKTINAKPLGLGAKLSLATLGAVLLVMAVLVMTITLSVTSLVKARAETEMQQSMDMLRSFLLSSDEDLRSRTKAATAALKAENLTSVSVLSGRGGKPMLVIDGGVANGDNSSLERFEKMTSAVSTLLVLEDQKFVRVASTVKTPDGNPAVGTHIATDSPVHHALMKGEEYVGKTDLFGKQYMAHYTPLFDGNKKLIGATFVGMDFSAFLENIKVALRRMKVGENGYYFVMEAKGPRQGTILVHPRVEGENLWERQDSKGGKYIQHMLKTERGVYTYDVVDAKTQSIRTMITAYDTFMPWNWTLAASINESEILQAGRRLQWLVGALGLLATALLTAAIYWLIRRQVVQPIQQGVQVTQAIAQGDLSQRVEVRGRDEMGQLLGAINSTADALEGLIRTVKDRAQSVTLSSSEIARGNADLASRTESSASALEQTAASMEELGATVRHNADNAGTADCLANGAQRVVTQSGEVVSALVQTMAGIDQSSQRIADIIGVIDGIAFQTNILALNAAVEAARAGEHGRGFAVVASEVRSLASRSAEAAKEIKGLIQTSVDEVRRGNERAATAGESMQQAMSEISKVSRVVSEISDASVEQSNGVAQVAEAITSMDQATQKNAALVEEMAAAAESLSAQADELLQAVAVFRLRQQ